jgi:hypothetical protein
MPVAPATGDKEVDSVTATYRSSESGTLIEAKRVETDTGIIEQALED